MRPDNSQSPQYWCKLRTETRVSIRRYWSFSGFDLLLSNGGFGFHQDGPDRADLDGMARSSGIILYGEDDTHRLTRIDDTLCPWDANSYLRTNGLTYKTLVHASVAAGVGGQAPIGRQHRSEDDLREAGLGYPRPALRLGVRYAFTAQPAIMECWSSCCFSGWPGNL